MSTMRAVQIKQAGSKLEMSQKEIPQPKSRQVRIKVKACGICHSDVLTQSGQWPGMQFPRCPGHEIAGIIDEIGPDVIPWKKGQRVGVGWNGGYCGHCTACRRGDFILCENLQIPGIHYDGGYADYVIAPMEAVSAIPDELSFAEAAPILCAGITTFNALRNSTARAGDLVAIQGVGGLGHLAIQFANKMGFKTVAVSRGKDKAALAQKLGAHEYLDVGQTDAATALTKLGGAKVILATAPSGKAMSSLINGLGQEGELLAIGIGQDPIQVASVQLISMKRQLRGWPSGKPIDSEDALKFCVLTGVRAMIEEFPLDRAQEAYDSMLQGKVHFRAVLNHT